MRIPTPFGFIARLGKKAPYQQPYEKKSKTFFFKIHWSKRSMDSSRLFPTMVFFNHRKAKTSFMKCFFLVEFFRADLTKDFLDDFKAVLFFLIKTP
jgi:hypothetical protein